MSDLVIVESPAKAKTIEKYLGEGYVVKSSYGHVRDLKSKDLSVDVDNRFEPTYEIPPDKQDLVKELANAAKNATTVWLATDEDREGEAISWHLKEALHLSDAKVKRITFHEITKSAIQKAIESPRNIDVHLVDAQQARRVLDRLVGYELSPVLWRKVKPSLSAGRVQSVAVRLIVEREREILNFEGGDYFRVTAVLVTEKEEIVKAELPHRFQSEAEANDFLKQCLGASFSVSKVDKKPGKKSPRAPFTTSTLQQEASRKLGYSVSRTMRLAQRLYENGHITYMRTDSVNLSDLALNDAKSAIVRLYGADYAETRKYSTKSKGAQEAHEAIRPTELNVQDPGVEDDQKRLYDLIWKRTIACQMADARLEKTAVDISISSVSDRVLQAKGEVITFEGFLKVYQEGKDEEPEEIQGILPAMSEGDSLSLRELLATQRFERPPARFSEAALVKKLEELGIGRPSTYAPTISTVQKREYVVKESREGTPRNYRVLSLRDGEIRSVDATENTGVEKGKLFPTDIGMVVNDFLVEHFSAVIDQDFTANVEKEFDAIADGKMDWREMLKRFYKPFHDTIEHTSEHAERAKGERQLGTDPKSGRPVFARIGRYGPMVQIGTSEDEEKPKFASIRKNQSIATITYDEAMDLFKLPKSLGEYKDELVEVHDGRYGPYIKHGAKSISLAAGQDPLSVEIDDAITLIKEKEIADLPIHHYKGHGVTKGKGRFGPFIKWNGLFINVNRKYDWDNLSNAEIEELVDAKIQKEIDKVVHHWEEEGIRVEKARWGRHNIRKGKVKIELPKTVDAESLTLEEVQGILEKKAPKKKASKKKTAKKKSTKKTAKKSTKATSKKKS